MSHQQAESACPQTSDPWPVWVKMFGSIPKIVAPLTSSQILEQIHRDFPGMTQMVLRLVPAGDLTWTLLSDAWENLHVLFKVLTDEIPPIDPVTGWRVIKREISGVEFNQAMQPAINILRSAGRLLRKEIPVYRAALEDNHPGLFADDPFASWEIWRPDICFDYQVQREVRWPALEPV